MTKYFISSAIILLHYAEAPLCGIAFLGLLCYSLVNLQKPRKSEAEVKKNWRITLGLSSLIVTTYFAQGISLFWAHANQHTITYVLGSVLTWLCLTLALLENKNPVWHPYIGAWLIAGLSEIALIGLQAPSVSYGSKYAQIPVIVTSLRVTCFCALLLNGLIIQIGTPPEKHTDEEHQPLLDNEHTSAENGSAVPNGNANGSASYGTIGNDDGSEDSDEDDRDKEIKEAQRKRLEEEGGWLGYMKAFAVFLPHLWPKNDGWGKVCLFIMVLNIIQDRFIHVLVPRQIGIITTKLTEGQSFREVYPDVFIWLLLSWIGSYAGIRLLRSIASTYIENYSYTAICNLAFGHVMDLSMDFHANKDSGEVLKSVSQANALNQMLETVVDTLPIFLDLFIGLWYVTHLFDIYLAFLILAMTIGYVWSGAHLTSWTRPPRRTYVQKSRNENKTVYESVSNWQTVTYFNRGVYERDRYSGAIAATIKAQWGYLLRSYAGHALQELIMTLGWGAATFLAVWEISSGRKPIGNLVTLVIYWDTVTWPLYTMSYTWRRIVSDMVDAERVLQLLNTKSTVTNEDGAKDLVVTSGKVEFQNVHFGYDTRKEVLKDINLTVDAGKTIALVGETGGGKSTTLKLLFRFYDVTDGKILIDGEDIRKVTLSSLREALGVVPQDPSLFNQTILENIRYARLDATAEEIHEACRAAAIHDKIMTFPDGYKSKVGERGVKLSGGELQRIAIARVLVKNPRIVLLDEATSAVDSSTEQQIQEAFKKLSAGRTTFVVAHRLSTIREADMIMVIDHGEIVERGTHDDLLLKGGKYLELWTKQTTGKPSKANSLNEDKTDLLVNNLPADSTPSQELAAAFATTSADEQQTDATKNTQKSTDNPLITLTPPKTDENDKNDKDDKDDKDDKNDKNDENDKHDENSSA
jgi:ABC-type transport system involved in Fe-S cluster assembly fused permease/ATPase subunit